MNKLTQKILLSALTIMVICSFHLERADAFQDSGVEILAIIGEKKITRDDLMTRIDNLPEDMRAVFLEDPLERERLLKEIVRIDVFALEAKALKLDESEKFKRVSDEIIKAMLAEEYTSQKIVSPITVSETAAKRYHQDNREKFKVPGQITTSFFWVKAHPDGLQDSRGEKREIAEEIQNDLNSGELFSTVAEKIKKAHADIQTTENENIPRGRLLPEVETVVFDLIAGEVSPVIEIDDGFLVFKLHDKIPARALPYEDARDEILSTLETEEKKRRFKDEEARLFDKYKVQVMDEKIKINTGGDSGMPGNEMSEVITGKIIAVNFFQTVSSDDNLIGTMTVQRLDLDNGKDPLIVDILMGTKIFIRNNGDENEQVVTILNKGQTVEIVPKGPIMMSYPPKTQASKIVVMPRK